MTLKALADSVTAKLFNLKLIHAWVLAFVAIAYIAWAAPLALQP